MFKPYNKKSKSKMPDNIPFEIQVEIIKRVLPVKYLIRFRSVSKQWKALIDSSEFITHHSLKKTQPHHLLLRYPLIYSEENYVSEDKYVSIADDDSFPHHNFSPFVPPTAKLLAHPFIIDCSHGLVCLHGYTQDDRVNRKKLIVLWNPLIRKSIGIPIPDRADDVIGFGVCPKTSDPKIVKITCFIDNDAKAEVFTLSFGVWRSVPINLPFRTSLRFWNSQVVVDGVIHWLTYDSITDKHRFYSFDLASEEFGEALDFPYNLIARSGRLYDISKINESLVVLSHHVIVDNYTPEPFCDIWMMLKNGAPKSSFTKLYTVKDIGAKRIIGFRKNGQPIMIDQTGRRDSELEVYEPCSERINGLGIYGLAFMMNSYTESLLLLNHSDSIIQS